MKNIRTKMTALVLALCVLVGIWPAVTPAAAAAGSSMENATAIAVGETVQVTFTDYAQVFYSFQTTKPGQFIQVTVPTGVSVGIYGENETWFESYWDGTTRTAVSGERGTYYIRLSPNGLTVPATVSFTVNLVDNDEYECNNTMATAAKIEAGKTVDMLLDSHDRDWFAVETTKPGQIIRASMTWSGSDYYPQMSICDAGGNSMERYGSGGEGYKTMSAVTNEAGTYYIKCWRDSGEIIPASLTVTLEDNDEYEPNGTKESAHKLESGETAEFTLGYYDVDWFAVETTKPGQDIQIDISGFHYANQGRLGVSYDETITEIYVNGNKTFYFHAAEAGTHYIKLYEGSCSTADLLKLAVTATVLDGDKHESKGNDSTENAVTLNLGTDETFNVGGWGDEDWFAFEVAESGLYTLQFRDLNPDYSDKFYYEVYAPDGTVVADRTLVNIYHSNILSCDQQGLYKVRIYSGWYGYSHSIQYVDITRSELRIRVSMGGADPYENNDTWLEAKPIQPGQLTQHVLATSTDRDWFYFTAEEADMSFTLELDKRTYYAIYRAEDLAEFGANANRIGSLWSSDYDGPFYYKLDGAGVYYLCLSSETVYASEELRSFTVTLEPHGGGENNDTWDKATPIYEGAPQEFDLAGYNDPDWFKFTVPEGATKAALMGSGSGSYYVYREEDIISVGLNAKYVYASSVYGTGSMDVSEGTYYIKAYAGNWNAATCAKDCTLTYYLSYPTAGSTIADAVTLAPGVWSESTFGDTYYSLGELKAGDVVRYSRDRSGTSCYVSLYSSTGREIDYSNYANDGFYVSEDGTYYLYVPGFSGVDANGEPYTTRIRYDIGTGSDYATTLEGPDTITLTVGEKQFVDLRLAPYTAKGNTNYIYLDINTDSSVATYSSYTGYVTAASVGSTQMTFEVWCGGEYLTKTVTVNVVEPVAATGVSLSNAPAEMELGSSAKLTATLTPVEATEDVVWSSSDKSVLYVSPVGKVVAVGEGEATITASVAAGSDSVTIKVVPTQLTEDEITGVELNEYALTMYMGEGTRKLTATVKLGDNELIVTGELIYVADATLLGYDSKSDYYNVYINGVEKQIAVKKGAKLIENTYYNYKIVDGIYELTLVNSLVYIADATALGVDANGYYYNAFFNGVEKQIVISRESVTLEDNKFYNYTLANDIYELTLPATGCIEDYTLNAVEGTAYLYVSDAERNQYPITENAKIVNLTNVKNVPSTVDDLMIAAENNVIKVDVELVGDAVSVVYIYEYSMAYSLSNTGSTAAAANSAAVAAASDIAVKWTSSNTAVAAVDQNGVVTAVAPGISIITAAAGDYNASCIVTVQAERVRVTGISFPEEKLQIPLGGQSTLLPTIEPYNATTRTLTWVSDDPSVATVSRTGIVNALAVGVTTIRATTMDGGFVAEITIEVTAAPQLGDINGDGRVDSADALITLQVAVGLRTLTEEEMAAADVNKDGFVDAGDGVKILRYDAKLIDSLE